MPNLFVYGTLQFPQIVKRITGKTFQMEPAELKGYRRFSVKGADYPAIYADPGATVKGVLLENVDPESLNQIIHFEGNEYEMREIVVRKDSKKVNAITFVWKEDISLLDKKDWDCDGFESSSLHLYT